MNFIGFVINPAALPMSESGFATKSESEDENDMRNRRSGARSNTEIETLCGVCGGSDGVSRA
jgi:hypothetical protein